MNITFTPHNNHVATHASNSSATNVFSLGQPQTAMPMNYIHDQTNMASSANFYETPYINSSNNIQQDASSFYPSVVNSSYVAPSQNTPMDERIGQINSGYTINYSQRSYATQYIAPTCSTPDASPNYHNFAPNVSNDYSRVIENSANMCIPPHSTMTYTSSTISAPYVCENHSRSNRNLGITFMLITCFTCYAKTTF